MIRSIDTLKAILKYCKEAGSNFCKYCQRKYERLSGKETVPVDFEKCSAAQLHGRIKNEQRVNVGNFTFGNQIDGSYLNTQSGSMHETDLKTDFAINGAGYFTVRMNNGQIGYTRNGNFTENRQGQLVTQEGYAVLGANGQAIQANEANPNFMIVSFNNASALQNQGNTIYTSNTAGTQIRSEVVQGMLEGSNTDTAQNMVDLIQTSREFEANQKF